MKIFDTSPDSWQDLQCLVAQLFMELNYDVKIEHTINLTRGSKEVDVYATKKGVTSSEVIICECKQWNKPIPQEVVHSFTTIVQGHGANFGYIIAKSGFQKGSYEAAALTNIKLLSFEDLQDIYFDQWLLSIGEQLMPFADRLFPYWDYPGRLPKIKWVAEHREKHRILLQAFSPFHHLGPSSKMRGHKQDLPITIPEVNDNVEVVGCLKIETYRQFFDFIRDNADKALSLHQINHGEIN